MSFYLFAIFGLSILIAGVIAVILFKKINKAYYPFIYYIWLGCLNEVTSIIMVMEGYQTLAKNNVYALIGSLLLIWFFHNLNLFKNIKWMFTLLMMFILVTWVIENFILGNITVNSTYFRIIVAIIIVILSLITINKLVFSEIALFKSPLFILCISFLLFFSFRVLHQAFVIYGSDRQGNFLLNLYSVMLYVILATNLLYALAVLWMPKKANSLPR